MKQETLTREQLEEQERKSIAREAEDFLAYLMPFGGMDFHSAISTAMEVGIYGREFAELVEQYCKDNETTYDDVDINYVIYEHILQQARNTISDLCGYDLSNDFKGDGAIYVYGNAMCTDFDHSDEAATELQKVLKKQKKDVKTKLHEDKFVEFLCDQIEIKF